MLEERISELIVQRCMEEKGCKYGAARGGEAMCVVSKPFTR